LDDDDDDDEEEEAEEEEEEEEDDDDDDDDDEYLRPGMQVERLRSRHAAEAAAMAADAEDRLRRLQADKLEGEKRRKSIRRRRR
jgi:CO dehydrogenase/acetyl-CoA synthase beta subunit